ncbi:MAG: hypothetical protein MAG581_01654 [Deltaproteobacteria bacterium]|nr:hypothetical protein [Deltaproteobacteria bacterium]
MGYYEESFINVSSCTQHSFIYSYMTRRHDLHRQGRFLGPASAISVTARFKLKWLLFSEIQPINPALFETPFFLITSIRTPKFENFRVKMNLHPFHFYLQA